VRGNDNACFDRSIIMKKGFKKKDEMPGCYQTRCDKDKLYIKVENVE